MSDITDQAATARTLELQVSNGQRIQAAKLLGAHLSAVAERNVYATPVADSLNFLVGVYQAQIEGNTRQAAEFEASKV